MTANSIAVVSGQALGDYHFGDSHPFGPQRLQVFLDAMREQQLHDRVTWLEPRSCHLQHLLSFHTAEHVERVKQGSDSGEGYLDYGDTPARRGIYEAAATVVGSVLKLVDAIVAGEFHRGFVPIAGLHHAYRDRCSGFCVFNDIGIAIEQLRRRHGLRRILYVDIDAHHGDGVYYSFESDPELFLVDFHEDGRYLYPGTGDAAETGRGPARGCKLNVPMPPGADDAAFAQAWDFAEAFMQRIEPEFIILQCGADSMSGDPITHLEYSEESFYAATRSLCRRADEHCDGRLLALGGGGYNLDNIRRAWPRVVTALLES